MLIGLFTAFSLFVVLMVFQIDMDAVRTAPLPSLELIYQVWVSGLTTLHGLFLTHLLTEPEVETSLLVSLFSYSLSTLVSDSTTSKPEDSCG